MIVEGGCSFVLFPFSSVSLEWRPKAGAGASVSDADLEGGNPALRTAQPGFSRHLSASPSVPALLLWMFRPWLFAGWEGVRLSAADLHPE